MVPERCLCDLRFVATPPLQNHAACRRLKNIMSPAPTVERQCGALFGIVAVPITITTMGTYGSTNLLTNVIYFNDDNDNTVKLLAQ
jgi:hypothetical protein